MTETEFLKSYDATKYEKPSVTADVLIFTMNQAHKLQLLLIKRGGHPFLGKWAIPGGFVNMDEDIDQAAARELKEETQLEQVYMEQLYTFGAVGRDPRMRVISVAYIGLVPGNSLHFAAGDDAAEAKLFEITQDNWELVFKGTDGSRIKGADLAFDHEKIIQTALKRLAGKVDYTEIGFELLQDKKRFSIGELQQIYEAIKGQKLHGSNFRRMFKTRYLEEGIVRELPEMGNQKTHYYELL